MINSIEGLFVLLVSSEIVIINKRMSEVLEFLRKK